MNIRNSIFAISGLLITHALFVVVTVAVDKLPFLVMLTEYICQDLLVRARLIAQLLTAK